MMQENFDALSSVVGAWMGDGILESWNLFQSNGMKEHKCYSHSSAPSDEERLKRNRRDAFKRK